MYKYSSRGIVGRTHALLGPVPALSPSESFCQLARLLGEERCQLQWVGAGTLIVVVVIRILFVVVVVVWVGFRRAASTAKARVRVVHAS